MPRLRRGRLLRVGARQTHTSEKLKMATYQEQIEAQRRRRERADGAERSFDRLCGAVADVLLPYIENKTLTHDQAAELMVKIVKAIISVADSKPSAAHGEGSPSK